jgi:type 1 glutamine amidotransferase
MSRLLVYSATGAYRHASIPAGVAAVHELGAADGFGVDATEDPVAFTPGNLGRYAAVIFMNTSGDVLDDAGRAALAGYVTAGGGYVGVHLASGTERGWPFYGDLVGARFTRHPAVQQAVFEVTDRTHPATAHLPARWTHTDEMYEFDRLPHPDVRMLMSVDESSYSGGEMGARHPITWCHRRLGGRAFYTATGHTPECYRQPAFRDLLRGGIRYAVGTVRVDDRPEVGYVPAGDDDVSSWTAPELVGAVKFGWPSVGPAGPAGLASPPGSTRPAGDVRPAVRLGDREVVLDGPVNPAGEWNTTELSVDGERLVGYLNGEKVLDLARDGWKGELSVTGGPLRGIRRRVPG